MSEVVQHIVNGLTSGSLYATFALGIALIFGIMRLVNFAHGELIMVGAYAAIITRGGPIEITIAAAVILPIVLALLLDRVAFRPIRDANPATMLVTSFAVAYLLQSIAVVMFGSRARAGDIGLAGGVVQLGDITVSVVNVVTFVICIILLTAVALYMRNSSMGLKMRAAAEDFEMVRLVGVSADRVVAAAFAISGFLAGVAALLTVAQTAQANPTMGLNPVLIGFMATIIGGLGSLPGAVVGGFLLGGATVALQATLPVEIAPYRDAFVFGAVFVLLVVRPQGLFGGGADVTRV